ncbi:MAG: BAX inhibitor (BI)-1/YccA family protein, partial [Spirochaetales bacterium]
SVVNLFLKSRALYWVISYIGVIVFCGLTAWDTQTIKRWSDELSGSVSEADFIRLSILGALKLYLDFITLFLFFLRIFGGKRS